VPERERKKGNKKNCGSFKSKVLLHTVGIDRTGRNVVQRYLFGARVQAVNKSK